MVKVTASRLSPLARHPAFFLLHGALSLAHHKKEPAASAKKCSQRLLAEERTSGHNYIYFRFCFNPCSSFTEVMNTFNRAQGMDNQKLGQFTSEIKCAFVLLAHSFNTCSNIRV
jgi:hypothetical protein